MPGGGLLLKVKGVPVVGWQCQISFEPPLVLILVASFETRPILASYEAVDEIQHHVEGNAIVPEGCSLLNNLSSQEYI